MNASGHPSQLTGCSLKCPTPCFRPTRRRNTVRIINCAEGHLEIPIESWELITSYQKKKTWLRREFYSNLFFKIVGLLCASRSHSVGEKGSVHWRTIAKNNMLYSNIIIIIIKQTAWFSNDTRMIEDGRFFFLFLFLICFDLIQVKMQFTESLTGGFEVSKSKRRLKWTFSIQSTSGEHF